MNIFGSLFLEERTLLLVYEDLPEKKKTNIRSFSVEPKMPYKGNWDGQEKIMLTCVQKAYTNR